MAVTNVSTDDTGGIPLYPAILCGEAEEREVCTGVGCTDFTAGVLQYDTAHPCVAVDPGVASCAPDCVDPTDPTDKACNIVKITMDPCTECDPANLPPTGGVSFGIGQNKTLVRIYKVAIAPIQSATGFFPNEFNTTQADGIEDLITWTDDANPILDECATGSAGTSSNGYYPPQPAIEITKDCTPASSCLGTPINFSGTVTNKGDEVLQKSSLPITRVI